MICVRLSTDHYWPNPGESTVMRARPWISVWQSLSQSDTSEFAFAVVTMRVATENTFRRPCHFIQTARTGKMNILDYEPHMWFLAEENGILYFDAACEHSAVSCSFAIEMSSSEAANYNQQGHLYLNRLAEDIHMSMPGAKNTQSPYKPRQLAPEFSERLNTVIQHWQE